MKDKTREIHTLLEKGKPKEALHLIERLPSGIRETPEILIAYAICEFDLENFEKAAELLVRYIEMHSGKHSLVFPKYHLGICYLEMEEYVFAKRQFLSIPKDHEKVLVYLGETLYKLGQFPEALEALENWIAKNQGSADGWWYLGLVANRLNNHQRALAAFKNGFSLESSTPFLQGWFTEAQWLRLFDEMEFLISEYEMMFDQDFRPWCRLGMACNSTSQYARAIHAFRKHLENNQEDDDAWVRLGINYYMKTSPDIELSIECFERAMVLKPNNLEAAKFLKKISADKK